MRRLTTTWRNQLSRSTKTPTFTAIALAGLLLAAPALSHARDVIDDAYMLCSVFEKTGLTTECEVKGGSSSVEVSMDTTGTEARKICAGVAKEMSSQPNNFKGMWKLKILSPYSGGKPIAVCTLY